MLRRTSRRRHTRPLRAAVGRFMREQVELLEPRTLLTSAATLYADDPTATPLGPQQATLWATATAEPIEPSEVTPSVVNGAVYSDLTAGSGYGAFAAATGLLGMEDYDSINDATINLSEFSFVGGVQNVGGQLTFEFYNTSDVLVGSFSSTFNQVGNFVWHIGGISNATIPDAGRVRIRAASGTTGQWFFSNATPGIGTNNPAIGSALAGNTFKMEMVNTSPNNAPTITSLSDTPDPVVAGGAITLTANGVNDSDGTVSSVTFYRESNGIGGLQTGGGGDAVVGTDNAGPTWSVVGTAPGVNGSYTYYAQATDNGATVSNVVSTVNQVGVGTITGTVWNDANNNQVFDGGEGVLSGWTVFLDTDRDQVLDAGETSTTTNGSGVYTFTNLPADTYWVTEVIPSGWTQTYPGAAGIITSANAMGDVVANVDPKTGLPDGVTTTGSDAPIYLPDGTAPVGDDQPYSMPNVFTDDLESNPLIRLTNFQSDSRFSTIRGQGQAVAVLDTGIDRDGSAFGPDANADGRADRIVYEQDFANGDFNASDFNGHGTNVASIVGSQNGAYPGMAPNVNIVALKVFTDAGAGNFSYIEAALQWVIANAATYNIVAINMSLGDNGNYNTNQALYGINDEMATLAAANIMVVSAAGNGYGSFNAQGVSYPAADANSLGVGAVYDADVGLRAWSASTDNTTGPDRIASFSQRSATHTEIFAPGAMILGGNSTGGTVEFGGTSQASPHIAGMAALAQQLAVSEIGRKLTQTEFKNLLQSTGVSIIDGDDENDTVTNTGQTFKRVDVLSMAEAIRAMAKKPNSHTVTLTAGETQGNVNFGNKSNDTTAPTADVVDVTPDPRTTAVGTVTINFSENVTGVDKSDFTLTRDGTTVSLTAATFAAVNASQYTLDLSAVTTEAGQYLLTLNPGAANNIEDTSGNDFVVAANDLWLKNAVDGTASNDTIRLVRNGTVINVFINNVTVTPNYTVNVANLATNVLNVLGNAGDDTINIDFSGGVPAPTNGLLIAGNAQTTADTLVLTGTTAAETATLTTSNFNFGATNINYTSVEAFQFNGGTTNADTLTVSSGVYTFNSDANIGTAALNLVVNPSGTVHFNSSQHLNALTISGGTVDVSAGGSKVIVTKSLSFSSTGKLDMRTHDLLLNYSGSSPIGTATGGNYTANSVQRYVQTGANGGSWNGNGLYTSDPNASGGSTALGVAEASDVFSISGAQTASYQGETVDATTVIVKYTYGGDANLDGQVTGDDYSGIDFAIIAPGTTGWFNGDFNWDGVVTGDDYSSIDFNILAQGGPL